MYISCKICVVPVEFDFEILIPRIIPSATDIEIKHEHIMKPIIRREHFDEWIGLFTREPPAMTICLWWDGIFRRGGNV